MTTFKNTVEHHNGEVIETLTFETLKEAKKSARQLKKKYEMISHAGHVVNYTKHIELYTNY